MEINEIFAQNLRSIMEEKRYRQIDIANGIGVSKQIVSAWASGQYMPRMKMLDKLCTFLGCNRSDLLEEKREPDVTAPDSQTEMIFKLINRLSDEQKAKAFDFLLSMIADNQ